MTRQNKNLRPLLWSVGSLVVIASISTGIVLFMPRSREDESRTASAPTEPPAAAPGVTSHDREPGVATSESEPNVHGSPDVPATSQVDQQPSPADRPEDHPDTASTVAVPASEGPGDTSDQASDAAPDTGLPAESIDQHDAEVKGGDMNVPQPRRSLSDGWRVQDLSVRARTFLYDGRDAPDGVWFRPSPSNQRFVLLQATLSWGGAGKKNLALVSSAVLQSRVWVTEKGRRFHPIGKLDTGRRGVQPLSLEPIECPSGQRVQTVLVFQVPSGVQHLTLEVDRQPLGSVDIAAPAMVEPADLAGAWRRVTSHIQSLRYEDPLANALADSDCRVLRVFQDRGGSIRLAVPCAKVESEPMQASRPREVIETTVGTPFGRYSARLRPLQREPPLVLLYVGEDEDAAFLFQRDPELE